MGQFHIILIPMLAHGHMIPMLDMAKLFASRGLRTTMIVTPAFADPVNRARQSGHDIGLTLVAFPPPGSSLPANVVTPDQVTPPDLNKFFEALALLQEPVELLLRQSNPDCLISDMFLPWTTDSAHKLGIPRLMFYGISSFAQCCSEMMSLHKPYKNVSSDSDPFLLPGLPHRMTFVKTQLSESDMVDDDDDDDNDNMTIWWKQIKESEGRSYGVVVNSFYELESAYADLYKNVLKRKAWHIGPLLLCKNNNIIVGTEPAAGKHECLAWLDSKSPNSVIYVCFGSLASFTNAQLHETAIGLESSGQDFVWVVRKSKKNEDEDEDEEFLPGGFEERMRGKGLIIRGWAPQVMILHHQAIGGFVTHCGWNSTLEGICAGLPMVTWPVFAEQFYNEKMVTEVLGTGVSVGNKKWRREPCEGVGREAVRAAVERIMVGEGAAEMRRRAQSYKEMARKAVEEGGSSYNALNALVQELRELKLQLI